MGLSVKVIGADVVKKMDKKIITIVNDATNKTAKKVANRLKESPPIKTGRLRRSQTVDRILAGEYDINWRTPYAVKVYHSSSKPYWDKDVKDSEIAKIFGGYVDDLIKREF